MFIRNEVSELFEEVKVYAAKYNEGKECGVDDLPTRCSCCTHQ